MQFMVLAPRSCCGTRTEKSCPLFHQYSLMVPMQYTWGSSLAWKQAEELGLTRKKEKSRADFKRQMQHSQGIMIHSVKYTNTVSRLQNRTKISQMPALFCFQPVSVTSTNNYILSSPNWLVHKRDCNLLLLATPTGQVIEIVILNFHNDPCGNQ